MKDIAMNIDDKKIIEQIETLGGNEQDPERAKRCVAELKQRIEDLQTIEKYANNDARRYYFMIPKAAAILAIVVLAGILMFDPKTTNNVAWAEIVEHFNAVKAFHTTVYINENDSVDEKIELWQNSRQQARLLVGKQVLFSNKGKIVCGYDISSNKVRKLEEKEYNRTAIGIAEMLGSFEQLSLTYVIKMFADKLGAAEDVTPEINPNVNLESDLLIYDLVSERTQEWMRIWALRESKLPTRIRVWDPRYGDSTEAIIDYSVEQSEDFYDADKYYEAITNDDTNRFSYNITNRAYTQHKDPTGKDVTPAEVHAKHGYHMPEIANAGITEYGAVWVEAKNAMNRTPNGGVFWGFTFLEDDLGRTYWQPYSTRHNGENSFQVFVPEGYPFDQRVPKELKIICGEQISHEQTGVHIGDETLTEWKKQGWNNNQFRASEYRIILRQAAEYCRYNELDKCEQTIEIVEKSDAAKELETDIKDVRKNLYIERGENEKAYELVKQLWDVNYEEFKNDASIYPFNCARLIKNIADVGKKEEARELLTKLLETKQDTSKLNEWDKEKEELERRKKISQSEYVRVMLSRSMGYTIEEVSKILGVDITKDNYLRSHIPSDARRKNEPGLEKWNEYIEELSKRYKDNPLKPGEGELIAVDEVFKRTGGLKIPEVPNHIAIYRNNSNMALYTYATLYKEEESFGRMIIPKELKDISWNHVLVMCNDENAEPMENWERRKEIALAHFGYEIVETEGECDVWVAKHDGMPLKNFKRIDSSAVNQSRASNQVGGMMRMSSSGFSLNFMFQLLGKDQNAYVENQTGIDGKTKISTVGVNLKGEEGAKIADLWYKKHFGITFEKTRKNMKMWEVRKKAVPQSSK